MLNLLPEHILSEEIFQQVEFANFYKLVQTLKINLNRGNLHVCVNTILTLIEQIYNENPEITCLDMKVKRSHDFNTNKRYIASVEPLGSASQRISFPLEKYQKLLTAEINEIYNEGYQGYTDYFKDMFFTNQFITLQDRNDRFKIYEQIYKKSDMDILKNLISNWEHNDYTPIPLVKFGSFSLPLFFSDFSEKNNFKKIISDIQEQEYNVINLIWESLAFKIFSFATKNNSEEVILKKIEDKSNEKETVFSLQDKTHYDKQQLFTFPLHKNIFHFEAHKFDTSREGSFHIFLNSFIDFIHTKRMIPNYNNIENHLTEGINLMNSQYEQDCLKNLISKKNSSLKINPRI